MIFIVGNSRSGTTMLGRILGRNNAIHTFGELHFFEQLVDGTTVQSRPECSLEQANSLLERLVTSSRDGFFADVIPGRYSTDIKEILSRSDRTDAVSLYAAFLMFETERNGKQTPCEQTPRYLFFIQDILHVFPDARIINMVRDPRDVLISQKNKWKRRFLGAKNIPFREALRAWSNYHPVLISKLWVSCIRQGRRFESDSRVKTLRFEDLLNDPEGNIRMLADFIGVPFEPDMLNVPQVGSSSGADQPVRTGINRARASGWQTGGLNKTEIAVCEWLAGNEMTTQGYTPAGNGRFSIRIIPSMAYLFVKLLFAVPMNLARTKNIRETLRRRLFVGSKA